MISRLAVVYSGRGHEVDGIRDHSERILEQLSDGSHGLEGEYVDLREGGGGVSQAVRRLLAKDSRSALILQYNPFAFARWGFAPWLPATLAALRLRRDRPFVGVMVHEPYVPMDSPSWVVLGIWQRLQLAAMRACADVTFTSITAWEELLRRSLPRGPVRHLPVGSNFPDMRASREAFRGDLGVGERDFVVAALGRDHPSWMGSYAVAAANAIAAEGRPTVLLALGASTPSLPGLDPAVRLERPGMLAGDEVAGRLAAADLFLAPLIDGVSTRRGSVMAGLQHGLPILGTEGPLTDAVLADAEAVRLAAVGRPDEFAAAAAGLAADPERRKRMAAAARRLYETEFDWPVVTGKLLEQLPTG